MIENYRRKKRQEAEEAARLQRITEMEDALMELAELYAEQDDALVELAELIEEG